MSDSAAQFDDLPTLLRLGRLVSAADPDGPPHLDLVHPETGFRPPPRRLAFLAGSFNPPHSAHLAIARAALDSPGLDQVVFALSKRTVDKATVNGLGLADRLLLLRLIADEQARDGETAAGEDAGEQPASERRGYGVALVNRGLYVDQAAIFRQAWPALDELAVVLGFDKIVQVFDSRYYADRDAALDRLFDLATVLVAPRAGSEEGDLAALLDRPENRRFAERVRLLPIPPDYAHLSSSDVRAAVGTASAADLSPLVRAFLQHTRAFSPPEPRPDGEVVDSYSIRLALLSALDRVYDRARNPDDSEVDSRLLRLALADGPSARALRAWLARQTGGHSTDLEAFLTTARGSE